MAGVKGRSGGRNRKSIKLHRLDGTYRRDRHGSLTRTATASLATLPAEPDETLLDGLGEDGARFLRATFTEYELLATEAQIVRLAALALDDSVNARAADDLKSQRASVRQFLAVLQRLGLPQAERQSS